MYIRRTVQVVRSVSEGRAALAVWRDAGPDEQLPGLRDPALLKLFMGADPSTFAAARASAHERQLAEYTALRATDPGTGPRGAWQVLDAGIGHEREWIRFWSALAGGGQTRAVSTATGSGGSSPSRRRGR